MRTFLACTLSLIVGTAYGQYVLDGARAAVEIIQDQRSWFS